MAVTFETKGLALVAETNEYGDLSSKPTLGTIAAKNVGASPAPIVIPTVGTLTIVDGIVTGFS